MIRALLGLAALGLVGAAPAPDAAITIDNFTFSPPELTVPPGTTVTWTNHDDIPHRIAATDDPTKHSAVLDTDDHYSLAFSKAGTYHYFCSLHPQMQGTVVVR